jgi:hypothetical protein
MGLNQAGFLQKVEVMNKVRAVQTLRNMAFYKWFEAFITEHDFYSSQ